jgi:diguanylate cyclase (GGDEF)-like protein
MGMHNNFTQNPRKIYHAVIMVWVILFVTVMWGIVAVDLQRAEKIFADYAGMHYQQANDRVHINKSILEGFAAMVCYADSHDRTRIRKYAQQMLSQYPHIYMFEIVEKVSDDKLESLSEYYRQNFYPDFEVKAFSYESNRQWQPVKQVPYHLPIVFMEPFPPESRKVLGLDVSSNDFFMRSLQKSEQQERAISTDPFKLVEGERAYLLHRPIPEAGNGGVSSIGKSGAQGGFAVLVIRADTLLDRVGHLLPGMRELLYNPAYSSTDPKGHLHLHESPEAGWLESRLFPRLSMTRSLDSKSQPFVLLVEQQIGWGIISWGKLWVTLLIAIITFGVVMVYARLYLRNEMERTEMTARLFHLANHDALTGLANRNLLSDRLNHAITQTARQKGQLAVLFLDLEEFKEINDAYGHDIGDGVLRRAAERLRACVRAGDTVARLGGDEFVVVLENISGQGDVDHVVEKIKTGFEQPFDVNSHSIRLGINIGCAIYPGDGVDGDTLIKCADSSMYKDKRSGE